MIVAASGGEGQTAGAVRARLLYDGDEMIAESNGSNVLQRRYVFGPGEDEPLVWYEGSGTTDKRWLHADERGSIVAVSDAAGALVGINAYDEYGIPASANIGRFQYTGQVWLSEIGMYYYKARIYSPTLGRFLQSDPIGYGDLSIMTFGLVAAAGVPSHPSASPAAPARPPRTGLP